MAKDFGIPVWEGCNKKRDELEKEYELIEEERKSIRLQREVLNQREDMLRAQIKELRKREVNNVLDFVRSYKDCLDNSYIDTILCHCQNTLNGNIDGTFVHFEDPRDKKE